MRKQWRCFHCDTVFTNPHCAAIHFGADESATCACVLPHEQHLINHIRDLEEQLARYRAEDSDVMRSIYTLEADHRQALIRAEEDGYNKGTRQEVGSDDGAPSRTARKPLPILRQLADD